MKKGISILFLLLICIAPILVGCKESPTTYNVTFMTPSHIAYISGNIKVYYEEGKTISVEKGECIGNQAPDATYGSGNLYSFVGWYTEKEYINSWNVYRDNVNSNMTLYAKYIKL